MFATQKLQVNLMVIRVRNPVSLNVHTFKHLPTFMKISCGAELCGEESKEVILQYLGVWEQHGGHCVGGSQKMACRFTFSSSTMQVPEIELRSLGLVASSLTC